MNEDEMTPEDEGEAQNKPDAPKNKGGEPTKMTLEEAQEFQNRVWQMKLNGMSLTAIAKVVQRSLSTVSLHYKAARLARMTDLEHDGWKAKAGEIIRKYEGMEELCRLHLLSLSGVGEVSKDAAGNETKSKGGRGTVAAAIWMQTYAKIVKQNTDFHFDVGVIPKASEKLDVTIRDARSMSLEELQREASLLARRLSDSTIVADTIASSTRDLTEPRREARTPRLMLQAREIVKTVDAEVDSITKKLDKLAGQ